MGKEYSLKQIDDISDDIKDDIRTNSKKGIQKASKLIPGFIESNFDKNGSNSPGGTWDPLTKKSITCRKMKTDFEKYGDKPLDDSGTLKKSFKKITINQDKNSVSAEITTPLKYGYRHNSGKGKTCYGANIRKREHMHINAGEHTDEIDKDFEGVW